MGADSPLKPDVLSPFARVASGIPENWPGECVLFHDDDRGCLNYHASGHESGWPTISEWRALAAVSGKHRGKGDAMGEAADRRIVAAVLRELAEILAGAEADGNYNGADEWEPDIAATLRAIGEKCRERAEAVDEPLGEGT